MEKRGEERTKEVRRGGGGFCDGKLLTQEVHERGLAASVGSNHNDPRAHVNADVQVLQPEVVAARILEVDIVQLHSKRQRNRGKPVSVVLSGAHQAEQQHVQKQELRSR